MPNDTPNVILVFLDDDDTPLPVPRTAMRFHLSEEDLKAWLSRDGALSD